MTSKEILGDQNFLKVLIELKKLHKEYPTIRLGTLIQAALDTRKKRTNSDLNEVSTKELLNAVIDYGKMMKENTVKKPKR